MYNWPQNSLLWGRGSERPAAHTQQKLTQVNPRQSFEVIAAQTSVLVNPVFSCQTGFFECEHLFIDKPKVTAEPAVPGTCGTFSQKKAHPASKASFCLLK